MAPRNYCFADCCRIVFPRTLSSDNSGWIVASAIFGLAHITNNGVFRTGGYSLLATIAGIFYGRTWRKTNSTPGRGSSTLGDTVWHLLFRTP